MDDFGCDFFPSPNALDLYDVRVYDSKSMRVVCTDSLGSQGLVRAELSLFKGHNQKSRTPRAASLEVMKSEPDNIKIFGSVSEAEVNAVSLFKRDYMTSTLTHSFFVLRLFWHKPGRPTFYADVTKIAYDSYLIEINGVTSTITRLQLLQNFLDSTEMREAVHYFGPDNQLSGIMANITLHNFLDLQSPMEGRLPGSTCRERVPCLSKRERSKSLPIQ